jgi:hypothetical protein
MKNYLRLLRPAGWPGRRYSALRLEALEPRCACSAGVLRPAALPDPLVLPPLAENAAIVVREVPAIVAPAGQLLVAVIAPDEVVSGPGLRLTAGVKFTGVVAHFDVPARSDYAATITWGDGRWSPGNVAPGGQGGMDVVGSVTYHLPGTYPITVKLSHPNGDHTTTTGSATVEPAGASYQPVEQLPTTPLPTPPPPSEVPPAEPTSAPPRSDSGAFHGPSAPPAGTGIVPWSLLPDPGPPAALVGAAEETNPEGAAAEPAYLLADVPLPADPPVMAAYQLPLDLRPGGPSEGLWADVGGVAWLAGRPVISTPLVALANEPTVPVVGPPPDGSAAAVQVAAEAVVSQESPATRSDEGAAKRPLVGRWLRCLTWGVALVFTERVLAARWGERVVPLLGLGRRPVSDASQKR